MGGNQYTMYEATRLQRRIETVIRHQKDRANIAKAAGDDDINAAKGDTKKLEDDLADTKKEPETAKGTIKTLEENKGVH